jgi:hypothetical protein
MTAEQLEALMDWVEARIETRLPHNHTHIGVVLDAMKAEDRLFEVFGLKEERPNGRFS